MFRADIGIYLLPNYTYHAGYPADSAFTAENVWKARHRQSEDIIKLLDCLDDREEYRTRYAAIRRCELRKGRKGFIARDRMGHYWRCEENPLHEHCEAWPIEGVTLPALEFARAAPVVEIPEDDEDEFDSPKSGSPDCELV